MAVFKPLERTHRFVATHVDEFDHGEKGLPRGKELDRLHKLEENLLVALATYGGELAGHRLHRGRARFIFYCRAKPPTSV